MEVNPVMKMFPPFKNFLVFIYFWEREREREREGGREGKRENHSMSRGGAQAQGDTESEEAPGSELLAQSPMWGLNSRTMRSWPELKLGA